MSGKLIHWFDLPVEDLDRAAAFYRTVLGVEFRDVDAPGFAMKWFATDEPHGGGALIRGGGRKPSADGTVVYFNAGKDLATALDRVESAGGRILQPKVGSDESGYVAFLLDTEGNKVALQSPR